MSDEYDAGQFDAASAFLGFVVGVILMSVMFIVFDGEGKRGRAHDADCEARVVAAALADSALPVPIIEHCEVE